MHKGNVHKIGQVIEFICVILKALPKVIDRIGPQDLQIWICKSKDVEKGLEFLIPSKTKVSIGTLKVLPVHTDLDVLPGPEFMRQGQLASSGKSDQANFEFYFKNQNLIPTSYINVDGKEVAFKRGDMIVFVDASFISSGGHECVRTLVCAGVKWCQFDHLLSLNFFRDSLCAVVASES